MRIVRNLALLLLVACLNVRMPAFGHRLFAAAFNGATITGTPIVHKVEPPNWWVNYTPDLIAAAHRRKSLRRARGERLKRCSCRWRSMHLRTDTTSSSA
jgi:hypothetical protein